MLGRKDKVVFCSSCAKKADGESPSPSMAFTNVATCGPSLSFASIFEMRFCLLKPPRVAIVSCVSPCFFASVNNRS